MAVVFRLITCVLLIGISSLVTSRSASDRHPIIMIPGDGGSQLWAKLDKHSGHWFCEKKSSKRFMLWANVEDLVWPSIKCLVDNVKLHLDTKTNKTMNTAGVEIDIPEWGNTETVEWLSNLKITKTSYYNKLAEELVNKHGYVRGENLRGAPYDFRKGPGEMGQFYKKLSDLIEDTYERTGGKAVILVGHSLGCKHSLHFLQNKSQSWKNKYIKSFVAAAPPFGGAVNSVEALSAGYNVGMFWLDPFWFREALRSWPSTFFLLPSSRVFPASIDFIKTPKRSYTVNDYEALFRDLGMSEAFQHRKMIMKELNEVSPPGVETHCVHGQGIKTPLSFNWKHQGDFPDKTPETIYGDGDGTVNSYSFQMCSLFREKQAQPVQVVPLDNAEHLDTLRDSRFINYVVSLTKIN